MTSQTSCDLCGAGPIPYSRIGKDLCPACYKKTNNKKIKIKVKAITKRI